eukprot:TRINITY_DN1894_c0_g1_i2.p1 TRINITY_DN1894_c0_g1~~TRINITY_DN1894_c0_g1_i2.p1  ORF type:complete len:156 (+),score=24.40 TRINITY_DN1894_c0_g1_i2:405-872(+)
MNVDGLHQRAGVDPRKVHEVHGTVTRHRCIKNGHPLDVEIPAEGPPPPSPICQICQSYGRPDCVLFTEALPYNEWTAAANAVRRLGRKDVMIVVGTSGVVYPAAGLPEQALANGVPLIEVNLDKSPLSSQVTCLLAGRASEVLVALVDRVIEKLG